jgi:hypothetical protein
MQDKSMLPCQEKHQLSDTIVRFQVFKDSYLIGAGANGNFYVYQNGCSFTETSLGGWEDIIDFQPCSGTEGNYFVCTKNGLKVVQISASARRVVSIKASFEPGTFNERLYLPEKDIRAAV